MTDDESFEVAEHARAHFRQVRATEGPGRFDSWAIVGPRSDSNAGAFRAGGNRPQALRPPKLPRLAFRLGKKRLEIHD